MSIQEIVTLISTVGFPIVACVFMWRFISTTLKDFTETMVQNTAVLSKLAEQIDKAIERTTGRTNDDH